MKRQGVALKQQPCRLALFKTFCYLRSPPISNFNTIKISIILNPFSNDSIYRVTSINSISQNLTNKLNTIKIIILSKSLGDASTNRVGHLIQWSRALKVINKINLRLKFLQRKKKLTPALRRLLCNALIQPHIDNASSAWYTSLTQKMKNKIQITQNKCIRYCLQLDKMTHISKNEFETLNWLPVKDRFNQSINSIVFKYFTKQYPSYLNEVFELACPNNLRKRNSYLKLICPFWKTIMGQNALFHWFLNME